MFDQSARYYDALYRELKDYRQEAAALSRLLKELPPPPARRLLDAGCGTGEHAKWLARDHGYAVDGLDIEPDFVAIARAKQPAGRFVCADMADFDLGRQYDAVLCLFSSIAYARDRARLEAAFACFARHLVPGGWLLLEPWVAPEEWRPGQIDALEAVDPRDGARIRRTREGFTEAETSVLRIEYRVQRPGGRCETLRETHRLGLFSDDDLKRALAASGLELAIVDREPGDRRLWLARKGL